MSMLKLVPDTQVEAMRSVAAGRLSLPEAHAGILQRLRQLAIEHARSGVKDS